MPRLDETDLMPVELLLASINDMQDMHAQMADRLHTNQQTPPVCKPLERSFEASVKLFLNSGTVDDQAVFFSKVKVAVGLDGRLTRKAFVSELVSLYAGWLRDAKHHPGYLKYGWTYFGQIVDKIRTKLK